jgi:protein-L-isoaspartate(D-aspartate) O-methyltransferase
MTDLEMTQQSDNRDPHRAAREAMIERQLRARGVVMHGVLEAMRAVPRHLFVAHQYSSQAYADEALPSQEGQTISQPFMVGIMTQELDVKPGQRVLEIGTGTGYQTAILAYMAGENGLVCTIERVEALAGFARRRLDAMGVNNVAYFIGDGTRGWPRDREWDGPRSPSGVPQFDRIMVTAGSPEVPAPLLEGLVDDGILVVPVGNAGEQMLVRVRRNGEKFERREVLGCRFVPLIGEFGWKG